MKIKCHSIFCSTQAVVLTLEKPHLKITLDYPMVACDFFHRLERVTHDLAVPKAAPELAPKAGADVLAADEEGGGRVEDTTKVLDPTP